VIKRAALLTHPRGREAAELAGRIETAFRAAGVRVERTQRAHGKDRQLAPGVDLLVAVGGDGTVLRAQRMAVETRVPVLGVGAGRLGFLAEVTPEELDGAIACLLRGEYRIEHRRLLDVIHDRGDKRLATYAALNDAVLARGRSPRSLWISVSVDGAHMANHVADGLIAATATGSTAYSLAAGGPIVSPELAHIVLTPIAAHLSVVQSVIVPGESRVEMALVRSQDAALTVDGQVDVTVSYGDRVTVTNSETTAQFVRFTPPSQFYTELVPRLQHNLERTRGPSGTDVEPPKP
jgi:NAD+ kinase